jgi:hypothetical protein
MSERTEVVGLVVGGLASLREALGSAERSVRSQFAWDALVEQLVTEIRFAYLDGVEAGVADPPAMEARARVAAGHGERLRFVVGTALAGQRLLHAEELRAAAAYWAALHRFATRHDLDLRTLPTFDARLHAFDAVDASVDPDFILAELEAALEILGTPRERTAA